MPYAAQRLFVCLLPVTIDGTLNITSAAGTDGTLESISCTASLKEQRSFFMLFCIWNLLNEGHWIIFQIAQSFQPHYGVEKYSASNRNEYQGHSWKVKRGRCLRLETCAIRFASKCESFNISHAYVPPRLVTGIALLSSQDLRINSVT
jgi:hypothetical protein